MQRRVAVYLAALLTVALTTVAVVTLWHRHSHILHAPHTLLHNPWHSHLGHRDKPDERPLASEQITPVRTDRGGGNLPLQQADLNDDSVPQQSDLRDNFPQGSDRRDGTVPQQSDLNDDNLQQQSDLIDDNVPRHSDVEGDHVPQRSEDEVDIVSASSGDEDEENEAGADGDEVAEAETGGAAENEEHEADNGSTEGRTPPPWQQWASSIDTAPASTSSSTGSSSRGAVRVYRLLTGEQVLAHMYNISRLLTTTLPAAARADALSLSLSASPTRVEARWALFRLPDAALASTLASAILTAHPTAHITTIPFDRSAYTQRGTYAENMDRKARYAVSPHAARNWAIADAGDAGAAAAVPVVGVVPVGRELREELEAWASSSGEGEQRSPAVFGVIHSADDGGPSVLVHPLGKRWGEREGESDNAPYPEHELVVEGHPSPPLTDQWCPHPSYKLHKQSSLPTRPCILLRSHLQYAWTYPWESPTPADLDARGRPATPAGRWREVAPPSVSLSLSLDDRRDRDRVVFRALVRTLWDLEKTLYEDHVNRSLVQHIPGLRDTSVFDSSDVVIPGSACGYGGFLLYYPWYGQLNNQLTALANALYVGQMLKLTVVLPNTDDGRTFADYFDMRALRMRYPVISLNFWRWKYRHQLAAMRDAAANGTTTPVDLMLFSHVDRAEIGEHKIRRYYNRSAGVDLPEDHTVDHTAKGTHKFDLLAQMEFCDRPPLTTAKSADPDDPMPPLLLFGSMYTVGWTPFRFHTCKRRLDCANPYNAILARITLAQKLAAAVERLLATVRRHATQHASAEFFTAVHVRNMDNECRRRARSSKHSLLDCEPDPHQLARTVAATFDPHNGDGGAGGVVYVAHDGQRDDVLAALRAQNALHVLTLEDVAKEAGVDMAALVKKPAKYTPALLDAAVCEAADRFVGNAFSTFSRNIVRRRWLLHAHPCHSAYTYTARPYMDCATCYPKAATPIDACVDGLVSANLAAD